MASRAKGWTSSRDAVDKKLTRSGKLTLMPNDSPRERLRKLVGRSGRSATSLARDLGYQSAPGFLRYLQKNIQGDKPIPYDIVRRLVPLLVGAGTPPITADELMSCTDLHDVPKPIVQAFVCAVDDGDGLLTIRYRVEPGVFFRAKRSTRNLGASRIGVNRQHPPRLQFAVALNDEIPDVGGPGTELQCVAEWHGELEGKLVVVGAKETDDLIEVRVGRVLSDEPLTVSTATGIIKSPVFLGAVVGKYEPV